MHGWLARLRLLLPRRRRRLWRYVSGRRRRVGLGIFAVLMLLAYGYWSLTNDARTQKRVAGYLSGLTGGHVKIDRARFSLFGGIRVVNLRLFLPDEEVPFFQAPQVLLSHHPAGLLFRGRLEPTEIVCVKPQVTLVEEVSTEELNVRKIFPLAGRAGGLGAMAHLPAIRLREGQLEYFDLDDGRLMPVGKRPLPWAVTLLPGPEGKVYQLSYEGQMGTIGGSGTIDTTSGATHIEGWLGFEGLDRALPRKYRKWKQRYKLKGRAGYAGDAQLGPSATTTAPAELKELIVSLEDVSMELPPEEGGLKLVGVQGKLIFTGDEIRIRPSEKLTGRIEKAGNATFSLHGEYEGYKPTSPFRIELGISQLPLPPGARAAGAWGQAVAKLHELEASGSVDISAVLRRDEDGKIHANGKAELSGVSIRLPQWPIRVDQINGSVSLTERGVELQGLRGRHAGAAVEMSGWLADASGLLGRDVKITARDLPLSRDVRDALPERYRKAWDAVSPRGQANLEVRTQRAPDQQPTVAVTVDLTGKASMEYEKVPYRLDGLVGQVFISRDGVEIRSVRGKAGPMQCELNGKIDLAGEGKGFEIVLREVTDLPLDQKLAEALPSQARAPYEKCGLRGRADISKAVFRRQGDGPVDYEIPVALKGASITHTRFPYEISDATGTLVVTPSQVKLDRLVGRHGRGRIILSGEIPLAKAQDDCQLRAEATNLALDAELRDALPASARRGWELLAPTGTANVSATFHLRPPGAEGDTDYRLVVQPRDMIARYRDFPYPLRLVDGQAVVVPGEVALENLSGRAGASAVALSGRIVTRSGGERVDLRISTDPIPIDKQLLAALPAGLVETLRLRPGGTAELKLQSLHFSPIRRTTTRPAGGDAVSPEVPTASSQPVLVLRPGEPATQPAGAVAWGLSGRITLKDAEMELGLEGKRICGYVEGTFSCEGSPATLVADANVVLDDLVVGSRRLGKFTGRLRKKRRSSILRIDDISGRICGGRVAGVAEVRLTSPARYGLKLSAESLDLKQLLAGQAKGAEPGVGMEGLLTGNLQMTGIAGDPSSRQATGKISIRGQKLYRLPVLLGFLHVIYLTPPGDPVFRTGQVSYCLRGDKLSFLEIQLQGTGMSMVGGGSMDIRTGKLDLTFVTGPPRMLPSLGALEEVIDGITGEFRTVRLTGTVSKPKISVVPLRRLRQTLRELLDHSSQ